MKFIDLDETDPYDMGWFEGYGQGTKDTFAECIDLVDAYFERGGYSPAQLMDELHDLVANRTITPQSEQ
jgi:hypothetical protein